MLVPPSWGPMLRSDGTGQSWPSFPLSTDGAHSPHCSAWAVTMLELPCGLRPTLCLEWKDVKTYTTVSVKGYMIANTVCLQKWLAKKDKHTRWWFSWNKQTKTKHKEYILNTNRRKREANLDKGTLYKITSKLSRSQKDDRLKNRA